MRERFKVGVTEGVFQRGVGQRIRGDRFPVNGEGKFGSRSSEVCYGVQCCGLT